MKIITKNYNCKKNYFCINIKINLYFNNAKKKTIN